MHKQHDKTVSQIFLFIMSCYIKFLKYELKSYFVFLYSGHKTFAHTYLEHIYVQ